MQNKRNKRYYQNHTTTTVWHSFFLCEYILTNLLISTYMSSNIQTYILHPQNWLSSHIVSHLYVCVCLGEMWGQAKTTKELMKLIKNVIPVFDMCISPPVFHHILLVNSYFVSLSSYKHTPSTPHSKEIVILYVWKKDTKRINSIKININT